jgi:hypothetical protein
MSSQAPRQYFEFEERSNISVGLYYNHLMTHYRVLHDGLGRMKQMCITEICLVKEMDTIAEHEYLVVCIQPPCGPAQYLSFERHPGNITKRASESDSRLASTTFPSPRSSLSSQSSLNTSSKRCDAHDDIGVLDSNIRGPRDRQLEQITFTSSDPLYLYQLVVLAVTVHNSKTCYQILSNNCYWFSRLMLNILERKFRRNSTKIVNPLEKKRPTLRKSDSGQLIGMSLYKPASEEEVENILADLTKGIQDFESEVISMFQSPISRQHRTSS